MESGRDEEEETLDDSLEETSVPVKLRRNGEQKRPEGRAPTMTIEIVRVGRPLKVSLNWVYCSSCLEVFIIPPAILVF